MFMNTRSLFVIVMEVLSLKYKLESTEDPDIDGVLKNIDFVFIMFYYFLLY